MTGVQTCALPIFKALAEAFQADRKADAFFRRLEDDEGGRGASRGDEGGGGGGRQL